MKNGNYFPGLHALRFIAASMVIFHHIHQYKFWMDLPNQWGIPIIDAMGHQAVSFFFVLSGFLISYLLMAEHKKHQRINISHFYLKRVLRIWPLYFVIVALALWILPYFFGQDLLAITQVPYSTVTVVALLGFIPNVLRIVNPTVVGANQLWSVGIEEQFYIIWPLLVRAFIKNIKRFFLVFVLMKLVVHFLLYAVSQATEIMLVPQMLRLYELFPVEQMAIGAWGAYLVFTDDVTGLHFLRRKPVFVLSLLLIGVTACFELHFIGLTYLEAVLFTIIILNIIHRKSIYQRLEHKMLVYLGNISYGIYMYHSVIIFLIIILLKGMGFPYSLGFDLILYIGSFSLTLLISSLSYTYFERPFLTLKDYLTGGASPKAFSMRKAFSMNRALIQISKNNEE